MRQTDHNNRTNRFEGKVNTDVDPRYIGDSDFISAFNFHGQYGSILGSRVSVKSNQEVAYVLPDGENVCIGSVEDKQSQWLIYFVWNSNNDHSILLYDASDRSVGNNLGNIYEIAKGSVLGFELTHKINHAHVVDSRYLYWTDGKVQGNSISGRPPRHLDIEKALRRDKVLSYYLDVNALDGDTWGITFTLPDGTNQTTNNFHTTPNLGLKERTEALVSALQAFNVDVEQCGDSQIKIAAQQAGTKITILGSGEFIQYPINHYDTITEQHIDLIVKPSMLPPKPYYVKNTLEGNMNGFTFQFRTRLHYRDKSMSAWSALSYIPTNLDVNGANDPDYTSIRVELNIPDINSPLFRELVEYVELGVQYGNNEILRSVKKYGFDELTLATSYISFYNDGVYSAVASDEDSEQDVQAIKFYDNVPQICTGMAIVADDKGKSRMILSGNLENYDNVDCAEVVINRTNKTRVAGSAAAEQTNFKGLKENGRYDFGIVYEDGYGRKSNVLEIGTVLMQQSAADISFEISHLAPPWAKYYRIVRTKNLAFSDYFQTVVKDWNFVTIENVNAGAVVPGTFADATHTELVIPFNDGNISEDQIVTLFSRDDAAQYYNPENRDRVRSIGTTDGSANFPFQGAIDGYAYTVEGLKVYIRGAVTNTNNQVIVEFYRRNISNQSFYYETGIHGTITNRFHSGDTDQSTGVAAVVNFIGGDTYYKQVSLEQYGGTGTTTFESPLLYPTSLISANEDIGRINAVSEVGQVYFKNMLRISDAHVPNSSINGIRSYRSELLCFVDRSFGAIQKLMMVRDVLLAICSYKIQPFYVNQKELLDLRGGTMLGISDALLNQAQELNLDLGTQHPSSVVTYDGMAYGWDQHKGQVWRYSSNGVFAISDYGKNNDFRNLGEALRGTTDNYVYGCYDPKHRNYLLTFDDQAVAGEQTHAFEEGLDGWIGQMSFVPEFYGLAGVNVVSFKKGKLYVHNQVGYCNFYGVQYNPSITFVSNLVPEDNKLFWNIRIQSDSPFYAPSILVYQGSRLLRSRLKSNKFNREEELYYADFLRNMDDKSFASIEPLSLRRATALLRGEHLRGQYMVITLEAVNGSVKNVIHRVDIETSLSKESKN